MGVAPLLENERRLLVERLRRLEPAEWDTLSLCAGWTVRHVVAHLTTLFTVSPPRLAAQVVRSRGIAPALDAIAVRLAERDPAELVDVLERHAAARVHPPGLPLAAPLTDVVAHSADIRWAVDPEPADWADPARLVPVLGFVVSRRARAGFVPPGRLAGLRLVATDGGWSHGAGAEVRGGALALAMAALGRGAALPLLAGDGVTTLETRLGDQRRGA